MHRCRFNYGGIGSFEAFAVGALTNLGRRARSGVWEPQGGVLLSRWCMS